MSNYYRLLIESSIPIEPEYQAVLDKATSLGYTLPSANQQEKDNKKVFYLKQQGIWSDLELLYNFKTEAGLENFTKLNWFNPNLFALTSTNYPVLNPNDGYIGATGKHLNTNWTPNIHATKCIPNNGSVFFSVSFSFYSGTLFGCRNTSANNFSYSGNFQFYGSSAVGVNNSGIAVTGHNFHSKNGIAHSRYENGSFVSTFNYSSTGTQSVPMTLMAWNLNGSISQSFIGGTLQYWGNGNKNIEAKQLELYKIMKEIAPFN